MKKALIVIMFLSTVFLAGMFIFDNDVQKQDRVYIAVSSFPLYEIVNKITHAKVEIVKLVPFGIEPHTYTPSVKTMKHLNSASLVFYNGLGMEPWITQTSVNGIDMSSRVHLIDRCEEEGDEHDSHAHHSEGADPHYWLDIDNMIAMTEAILSYLIRTFPKERAAYTEGAEAFVSELKGLKEEFDQRLGKCKRKEIVVNHDAFGYLGHEYGFTSHALTGLSPDEQVSAKRMKEISDLVKEEGISTIFFESFVSDKVAQAIGRETGAQAVSLQPLANVTEEESHKGYIVLMRENLNKLADAMECR